MPVCNAPDCGKHYTPTRTWQKYCSARCRNSQHTKRLAKGSTGAKVLDAAMAWFRAEGRYTEDERLQLACAAHFKETKEEETDT